MKKTPVFIHIMLFTLLLLSGVSNILVTAKTQGVRLTQVSGGRIIDVFTQKGGKGYLVASHPFLLGEEVIVYANVTYNDSPVVNKLVAFQVFELGETVAMLIGITNTSGIANMSFRLPFLEYPEEVLGIWSVLASVDVAEVVLFDTVDFNVNWNLADINHDLKVDIKDIALVAKTFGSHPDSPNWNPHANITGLEYLVPDGKVDIRDIPLIASHFGETYP